jgi:hypothetical protein
MGEGNGGIGLMRKGETLDDYRSRGAPNVYDYFDLYQAIEHQEQNHIEKLS